jgi:hypothetical protein
VLPEQRLRVPHVAKEQPRRDQETSADKNEGPTGIRKHQREENERDACRKNEREERNNHKITPSLRPHTPAVSPLGQSKRGGITRGQHESPEVVAELRELGKNRRCSCENQLPTGDNKLSAEHNKLSGDHVSLSEDDISLSEDGVSLSVDDVSLLGGDNMLSGDDVSLSADDILLSAEVVSLPDDRDSLPEERVSFRTDPVSLPDGGNSRPGHAVRSSCDFSLVFTEADKGPVVTKRQVAAENSVPGLWRGGFGDTTKVPWNRISLRGRSYADGSITSPFPVGACPSWRCSVSSARLA